MSMEVYVREDGMLAVRQPGQSTPAFRATGTPDVGGLYVEGGLFGTCKHDPVLVNALVGPQGFEGKLRWVGSDVQTPIYEALVYIGTTGHGQSSDCADCGKPVEKRCAQSACFGRICQQTNEVLFDDLGLRANFGVPKMTLFGAITDAAGNVLIPHNSEIQDVFVKNVAEAGYNLRLDNSQLLWNGNPANNLGGRREYVGFDLIINTGKFDVETHAACPQLDSTLIDYGNNVVGALGSPSIVAFAAALMRRLRFRADASNLGAETMVTHIVMHPQIWDCVADAWACEYGLVCPNTNAAAPPRQDARQLAADRDRMRRDMTLTIDGMTYPVTLDSQIEVTYGSFGNQVMACSDIYFITTNIRGEVVTWGEYQDLNKTGAATLAWFRQNFGATYWSITDGGRFIVAPTYHGGWCFDARILTKPRIISRMPWLSGRVQNVCCALVGPPYPDPSGSGGVYEMTEGAYGWNPNYLYGECWPGHSGMGE
jgi:hypothetical protein